MPVPLPPPLASYFAATNAHDIASMIAAFAEGALVKDEGQEYRGLPAIRGWMEESIRKYEFTVEVTDVAETDGRIVVTGLVSGNFPGSPVRLGHAFTLDHHQIASLEIG
jgi:hypothetical protein